MKQMIRFYERKGLNLGRQMDWLKKQGIVESVAAEQLAKIYLELKTKKTPHLDEANYDTKMAKLLRLHKEKKELREDFWIDQYLLRCCKERQLGLNEAAVKSSVASGATLISDETSRLLRLVVWLVIVQGVALTIFAAINMFVFLGGLEWISSL